MSPLVAEAARKKRRKKKKKKKRRKKKRPVAAPAPAPKPPTKYKWILSWDDSRGDGLVREVSQLRFTPQPTADVPPRPLPAPQNPGAPSGPQNPGVYSGPFGRVQAKRLLDRAGFGPKRGEAASLAAKGLQEAVYSLTRVSGAATLSGPAAKGNDGNGLAPYDFWGHDHLWWLDRMLRSSQPFVERLALIFHDWFATSNDKVGSQKLMIDQAVMFRTYGRGSFRTLLEKVTVDPAMIVWLDASENYVEWWPPYLPHVNENYAREVMELFTLGANTGSYTEADVRELAKALTGWTYDWSDTLGQHNFHYETRRHDTTTKTLWAGKPYATSGNFGWQDACRLCVEHPNHADFFVRKMWGYFIPSAPNQATVSHLKALYTAGGGYSVRNVVEAILMHPDFYEGPPMVKPPIVYLASLMRATGTYINREDWVWLSDNAGQRLFYPPNVSGWDDNRWLDTNTMRARWLLTTHVLDTHHYDVWNGAYSETEEHSPAYDRALSAWDYPPIRNSHHSELLDFAQNAFPTSMADWQRSVYRAARQNALRQLIAVSPDMQLS